MRRVALVGVLAALVAVPAAAAAPRVLVADFDSDVSPPTASWLIDRIGEARGYDAIVIRLDTPGGLDDSMRKIVKAELASKAPVIVYVAPGGARAASAGVWISQAADVLAMAPNTNIGSSTPITGTGADIGKDLRRKVVNDAAASLRALARSHGRNARWADRAVR
jgi:membrane-bound serine protease (ClpP class)